MTDIQDPSGLPSTPQHRSGLFARLRRLMNRVRALLSLPDGLDARFSRLHDELNRRLDQSRAEVERRLEQSRVELKAELSTQLGFSLHDFEAVLSEKKEDLAAEDMQQRTQAATILNELRNMEFETANRLNHLDTSLHSRLNVLENERLPSVVSELRSLIESVRNTESETTNRLIHLDTSLHSRLNTLENERLSSITEDIHQLTALHFGSHASRTAERAAPRTPESEERYLRSDPEPFSTILERGRHDFPRLFPLWLERLEATEKALHETKIGNAARPGDSASHIFRSFVELSAHGRLLDVGCGIFGLPYYLASYPANLVSGIDPLEPTTTMGFEFVRGLSEYLPWPDDSFSTVVSATSLDHSVSLQRSLAEILRVLRPGGRFLLWIDSIPGAPQYRPESENFVPADRFHLFHFDASWLEPLLNDGFDLTDRVELRRSAYSRVIYSLAKR